MDCIYMSLDLADWLTGRKNVMELARAGRLKAVKRGRRTLYALKIPEKAMNQLSASMMMSTD